PEVDYEKTTASGEEFAKVFYDISGRTDVQFGDLVSLSVFRPNIRMVNKFGEGRVFIVGDAAHTHSPTGGQGMNSSVLDAANVSWKIALVSKGLAPHSLLQTYSDERVPVIREMLGRTTRLLDRTMRPGEDRDEGWFRGGPLFMLGINYRWSPLAVDERRDPPTADERESAYVGAEGVCAGDRAPDAPVAGDVAQLFDLFKITRHVVLVFSADGAVTNAVVAAVGKLPHGSVEVATVLPESATVSSTQSARFVKDKDGLAYKAYEITSDPTIVVVRPDGFVGAVVKGVEGVNNYFKRVFV
ncbi:FAD binding domain-containing protein, partial [Schizophyllum fasciatum]